MLAIKGGNGIIQRILQSNPCILYTNRELLPGMILGLR